MTGDLRALIAEIARTLIPYDHARAIALAASLRREHPAEVVTAAMTQARLATRAGIRFGDLAHALWWTAEGLEQASRPELARRHASRLAEQGVRRVADLCCSLGFDALAFAEAGIEVVAVDRDPDALDAARYNADALALDITFIEGDVTDPVLLDGLAADAAFIDPARRSGGTRSFDPERWSPPWSWIRDLDRRFPLVLAKLAPGIAHAALPQGSITEWCSFDGSVLEAAPLWGSPLSSSGASVPGIRRAVLLDGGHELDDAAGPLEAEVRPVGEWLYEPAAAAIRAGLVAQVAEILEGGLLDPHIAYITADAGRESAWATRFKVLDQAPFGVKPLRAWLRDRGFGDVVIKKRGLDIEPEALRKQLRLTGSGPTATLVMARTTKPEVFLVERA